MTRLDALRLPALALLAALAAAGCEDRHCAAPRLACGDACVDRETDPAHCGSCGRACDQGEACQAGSCVVIDCGPGRSVCDRACAALDNDPHHCGDCATACVAGQVCSKPAGGTAACADTCTAGLTPCEGACVDLQADRYHCGGCGTPCRAGEGCVAGSCRSLQVACFATDDVRPVAPDLLTRGLPRAAGDGPIALAVLGDDVWAAATLSGSLIHLPITPSTAPTEYLLHGDDFEFVAAEAGLVFVSHAGASTLAVFDPATARVVDEIPLVDDQSPANPKGIAFAGGKAYVALTGRSASNGQAVEVLDASNLGACATRTPADPHCLTRLAILDVRAGADAGGVPAPGRAVTVGSKVYVALANLKPDFSPAGPGRLAVVDSADDSLSYVTLPGTCGNPSGLAVQGTTLWVTCGSFSDPTGWPGMVVPVDLAGTPTPGAPVDVAPALPGSVTFCGGAGYLGDQGSGAVIRFDPVAGTVDGQLDTCPVNFFAFVADIACAP